MAEPAQATPIPQNSQNLINAESDQCIADDFSRDVWCLLGLPFDNLTLASAHQLLQHQIHSNAQNVLSTVNVNWLAASLSKPEFHDTILDSDICTIDGTPLLCLARFLGLPFKARVQGSTFTDYLIKRQDSTKPWSIFLFGGDEGIAAQACDEINSYPCGLHAVGHFNPGFQSLDELHSDKAINLINATRPNVLLVALGAYKGQLWIAANKNKIQANIISHLGATINFLAQTEQRAPRILQFTGLEWVWRILQKPSLWRRYSTDGLVFIHLFVTKILPYKLLQYKIRKRYGKAVAASKISLHEDQDKLLLTLSGHFSVIDSTSVKDNLQKAATKKKDITLDFHNVVSVDNSFLGYLLILIKHQRRNHCHITIKNLSHDLEKIFKYNLLLNENLMSFEYSNDYVINNTKPSLPKRHHNHLLRLSTRFFPKRINANTARGLKNS